MTEPKGGPQTDWYAQGWEAAILWSLQLVSDRDMSRDAVFDTMSQALDEGRKSKGKSKKNSRRATKVEELAP